MNYFLRVLTSIDSSLILKFCISQSEHGNLNKAKRKALFFEKLYIVVLFLFGFDFSRFYRERMLSLRLNKGPPNN